MAPGSPSPCDPRLGCILGLLTCSSSCLLPASSAWKSYFFAPYTAPFPFVAFPRSFAPPSCCLFLAFFPPPSHPSSLVTSLLPSILFTSSCSAGSASQRVHSLLTSWPGQSLLAPIHSTMSSSKLAVRQSSKTSRGPMQAAQPHGVHQDDTSPCGIRTYS